MSQQTQYFDFSQSEDPFKALSSDALAILVPKSAGQLRIDIYKDVVTVGRTEASDVVIAHRNVSKSHAELSRTPSGWSMRDIGSTNGTFLNGNKITDPTPITPGDTLSFGDQAYTFSLPGETPSGGGSASSTADGLGGGAPGKGMTGMFNDLFGAGAAQAQAASAGPGMPRADSTVKKGQMPAGGAPVGATMMVSFDLSETVPTEVYAQLIEKSLSPKTYDLVNLRNRFGSANTNDIRIDDMSVKDEHGELSFESDGRVRLRTIHPDVFVKINGEPVKVGYVKDLDTLQIGDIVFTFKLHKLPNVAEIAPASIKKSGGGMRVVLIVVALLIVLGGAAFFILPIVTGSGEAGGGAGDPGTTTAGAGAAPTPTPGPEKSEFENVERLFLKSQMVEARDKVDALDKSDDKVAALKLAVDTALAVQTALDDGRITDAGDLLERMRGSLYETSAPIQKLKDTLLFEQDKGARDAFERADREFKAGRYETAQSFYAKADRLKSGYPRAKALAEASRLAKIATDQMDLAVQKWKEDLYSEAADIIATARNEMDNSPNDEAKENLQSFGPRLDDYFNYSKWMAVYMDGDAQSALTYYDKISQEFKDSQKLQPRADRHREVHARMLEAIKAQTVQAATAVLELETDPKNQYYKRAIEMRDRLAAEALAKAQQYFQLGMANVQKGDNLNGLQAFFEARKADPSYRDAEQAHADTAEKILREAYKIKESPIHQARSKEMFTWVLQNSHPEDSCYKKAEMQLKTIP